MLSTAIYEELRSRICFLEYPPATRLGEVELAREFGVSRTPIRAVLAQLAAEGLVDIRRGVPTTVTEIDPVTLLQTQEVRKELALLLSRISPVEDLKPLAERVSVLLEEAEGLGEVMTVRDFARLNARFFEVMLEVTGNMPLREICTTLYYKTARLWVRSASILNFREEVAFFLTEMREILAALERDDVQAVGHIRWLHLSASANRQREGLASQSCHPRDVKPETSLATVKMYSSVKDPEPQHDPF